MLSDHPDFNAILASPPPTWKQEKSLIYAITPDSSVPTLVSEKQLDELYYDAGLYGDGSELDGGEDDKDDEDFSEESILYYPGYYPDRYLITDDVN